MALAPIIIRLLRPGSFSFHEQGLSYFYHRYNMTWACERCVEIPIALSYLSKNQPEKTLEIGNVLSHYRTVNHLILDKFEKAPGVVNEDIISFQGDTKYDLIVSISTFEHIGFDDESTSSSSQKILEAVNASRSLLSETGILVISVPIGYNPHLDELLKNNTLAPLKETYLARLKKQTWRECSKNEALNCLYGSPLPYANAIAFLEFGRSN